MSGIMDVAKNVGIDPDPSKLAKLPTDFNNIQDSLSSVSSNNISTNQLANVASKFLNKK